MFLRKTFPLKILEESIVLNRDVEQTLKKTATIEIEKK